MGRLRDRFVDEEGSVGERLRQRRLGRMAEAFPGLAGMRVLDLGGRVETWQRSPVRPAAVDILNFEDHLPEAPEWIRHVQGDACDPPSSLADRYDLVFSNSVIEHVGGHERRRQFAATVHRLADRHWVQTPYRYFPIEPHYLAPGFQFLPVGVRARALTHWRLAYHRYGDYDDALRAVLGTELLGRAEMGLLFPGSRIVPERVAGLTKSLAAVKTA